MTDSITLKLTKSQETKLYEAFKEYRHKAPAYARWQLRPENCVITCYESGKTLFQGKDAKIYASPFTSSADTAEQPSGIILPQAGSDEVGTGDYFGPVCVCACIVTEHDMTLLNRTGVRDSKAITDEAILKTAPELMEQLTYSLLILNNRKYNAVHDSNNMNRIKARLHNQAYVNLSTKAPLPEFRVIDQFTPEKAYYRYLQEDRNVVRGIHFETKAEDKYPAVGAASVIARYAFLKCMEELSERYDMQFEKGAGSPVDRCAAEFVSRYGWDALQDVAKLHFANTEKVRTLI